MTFNPLSLIGFQSFLAVICAASKYPRLYADGYLFIAQIVTTIFFLCKSFFSYPELFTLLRQNAPLGRAGMNGEESPPKL